MLWTAFGIVRVPDRASLQGRPGRPQLGIVAAVRADQRRSRGLRARRPVAVYKHVVLRMGPGPGGEFPGCLEPHDRLPQPAGEMILALVPAQLGNGVTPGVGCGDRFAHGAGALQVGDGTGPGGNGQEDDHQAPAQDGGGPVPDVMDEDHNGAGGEGHNAPAGPDRAADISRGPAVTELGTRHQQAGDGRQEQCRQPGIQRSFSWFTLATDSAMAMEKAGRRGIR